MIDIKDMERTNLFTKTGKIWHFHPLGTGITINYMCLAQQLVITVNATGQIVECINDKVFKTEEEFYNFCKPYYLDYIDSDKTTLDMSYYDNATYIGEAKVEVDLELMKN